MVCISFISTDVLLLLFAQTCLPLLRRNILFLAYCGLLYQHFPESFIGLFCLSVLPLKAYVLHSFKVCFHKVLNITFTHAPMSGFKNEDLFMSILITVFVLFLHTWKSQSVCYHTWIFTSALLCSFMSDGGFHHVFWALK